MFNPTIPIQEKIDLDSSSTSARVENKETLKKGPTYFNVCKVTYN